MNLQPAQHPSAARRGAVAVEFAIVAPFLLALVVGLIEVTRVYDAQNQLEAAAREGARLAGMDRTEMLSNGQPTNAKLIQDVKNYLTASGIDANNVLVTIRDALSPTEGFDLDDPTNDLRLFELLVEVPYSAVSFTPVSESNDYSLSASIVFRNGRATLSQ